MEKIELNQNLYEAYTKINDGFLKKIERANELWYGTIRLLITLSTSILLVSVSFVNKISPFQSAVSFAKNILLLGWLAFLLAIVFGIIAELKGAEFYDEHSRNDAQILKEYLRKMAKQQVGTIEIDLNEGFVVYPSLIWAFMEVFCFVFGITSMAVYMLANMGAINLLGSILILFSPMGILGSLVFSYSQKRKRSAG